VLPCYPTPDPKAGKSQVGEPQARDPNLVPEPMLPVADEAGAPRPIGPERLRALREAILSGAYPGEAEVTDGLASLFRKPGPPPGGSPPPPRLSS
jgi:hypothetical protein